jgi:hypothetical protein
MPRTVSDSPNLRSAGSWARAAAGAMMALAFAGCAPLACRPSTIVVAHKEERSRVDMVSTGLFETTGAGRMEEVKRPAIVREYWVQSREGAWYPLPPDRFERAQVDRPLELCR